MADRSNEGYMDYEYQNQSGPVDVSSPWVQHTMNVQQGQAAHAAKKRTFNDFDSPKKFDHFSTLGQAYTSPARETPAKPLPATPQSALWTARHMDSDYASSPLDSPDNHGDNEATPDGSGFHAAAKQPNALSQFSLRTPKSSVSYKAAGVPGRGELARYRASAISKRVRIKRDQGSALTLRRNSSASDNEEGNHKGNASKDSQPLRSTNAGLFASFFTFIESHPNLPHILSFYAQLLLNVFLIFFFIYIIYCFWATIRSDVDKRSEEAEMDLRTEMTKCAQEYLENQCDPPRRLKALESLCNNWERCMNQDAKSFGRAKVSAHTFAEIFNSFIEPISYKAMIFSLVLVFGCVAVSNFAFGFLRNKIVDNHQQAVPHFDPQYQIFASPQQKQFGGAHNFRWNAYNSQMPFASPSTSQALFNGQSPNRQIAFHSSS